MQTNVIAACIGILGGAFVMLSSIRKTTPESLSIAYLCLVIGLLVFLQKPGQITKATSGYNAALAQSINADGGSSVHAAMLLWLSAFLLVMIHLIFGAHVTSTPLVSGSVGLALLGFGVASIKDTA